MKRTFSVLFFIRRTKLLKTGETNILMRLTVNGQYKEVLTQRTILPNLWNQKKEKTTGKNPTCIEINKYLDDLRARINNIYSELDSEGIIVTPKLILTVKNKPKEPEKMFYEEFENHNSKCEELQGKDYAKSTVDRYKLCLIYFKEMRYLETLEEKEKEISDIHEKIKSKKIEPEDFPIRCVSQQMIEDFQFFLRTKKDIGNNTCIRYLKCLHKIINIGFNNGWIKANPFANIKLRVTKGKAKFLTINEVNLIIGKEFAIKRLEQVRDVFIFCCFTGLAFIDVWQLRKEHIIEDDKGGLWIMKERQKTKIDFNVPLLEIPLKLIEKYKDNLHCQQTGKLLPVISNQKMNGYLKEIADLCGIKKVLSTHVARHTAATVVFLANDVSMENVSSTDKSYNIWRTFIVLHEIVKKII